MELEIGFLLEGAGRIVKACIGQDGFKGDEDTYRHIHTISDNFSACDSSTIWILIKIKCIVL